MTQIFILFYPLIIFLYGKVLRCFASTKSAYTNNTQMRETSLLVEPFKCFHVGQVKLIFQSRFAVSIRHLIAEGALSPYDPELVMEMLILLTGWIINQSLSITEAEEEPFKRFCVQWLSGALLPARGGTGPEPTSP